MASSIRLSSSQAPAASMASWSWPCSSSTRSISSGDISSPSRIDSSSNRVSSSRVGATASSTQSRTVAPSGSRGSWGR